MVPDFFLSSGDDAELNAHPRRCEIVKRIDRDGFSSGCRVRIDPPLNDLNGIEPPETEVFLFPRFADSSLEGPVSQWRWPIGVFVVSTNGKWLIEPDAKARILAWGDLYPTQEAAAAAYYGPMHEDNA